MQAKLGRHLQAASRFMLRLDKQPKAIFGLLIVLQLATASLGSHTNNVISAEVNTTLPALQQPTVESTENSSNFSSGIAPQLMNSNQQINGNNDPPPTFILSTQKPEPLEEHTSPATSIEQSLPTGSYIINIDSSATGEHESSSNLDLSKTRYSIDSSTESEVNELFPKIHSLGVKSRRNADNYQSSGDWWTKLKGKGSQNGVLTNRPKFDRPQQESKVTKQQMPKSSATYPSRGITKSEATTKKHIQVEPKRTVYQEQPLSQNSIITIRYQLAAIRNQQRALVTKSMPQLQQLDNKLIDFYKLCMKKKMPLYAGMLYRTRDFTNRMAKEVKHERQVLEAMTKQVQNVLRQKLDNNTLVREYNQLVAPLSVADIGGLSLRLGAIKGKKKAASPQLTGTPLNQPLNATELFRSIQELDPVTTRRPKQRYTVSVNEVNLKKELLKIQALIDRIDVSTGELNVIVDDINHLFKLKPYDSVIRKGYALNNKSNKSSQQDLEASNVLTSPDSMFSYDERRKKGFKSPVKVFFEKYGKLTMPMNLVESSSSSENNLANSTSKPVNSSTTMDAEWMKPLFEPSSMMYSESVDQDFGFDDRGYSE